MSRAALIGGLAGFALAAAGCGSGINPSKATPVATDRVDLPKSYRFDPVSIQVKAGAEVTWTNHDNFTHTVKLDNGPNTSDHKLGRGDSVTLTLKAPGTYRYHCTLHPHDMKGEVIVQ